MGLVRTPHFGSLAVRASPLLEVHKLNNKTKMDIECPYCGEEFDINHDDGFGYAEGVKHHQECPHCEKSFVFETSISFYYEPEKADCMNGDAHDYRLSSTYPRELSQMQCSTCGDIRQLSDDERSKFNIGTKESYFESLKQ